MHDLNYIKALNKTAKADEPAIFKRRSALNDRRYLVHMAERGHASARAILQAPGMPIWHPPGHPDRTY